MKINIFKRGISADKYAFFGGSVLIVAACILTIVIVINTENKLIEDDNKNL